MKKILLIIGLTLLIFSCKKEKFDLGVYKVIVNGTYEDNAGEKYDFSSQDTFVKILSETSKKIEVAAFDITTSSLNPSFILEKNGLRIKGDLPGGVSSPDGFYIKGSRNIFNSNISGAFETSLGTSIDDYFHYVPMTGKFKMVKQ